MRQTFSTFVATVCLLALFIGSAACLDLPVMRTMAATASAHTIATPDHECCPTKNDSGMHTSISCCTVHHQSAIATSATDVHPSLEIMAASLPVALLAGTTVAPPYGSMTDPPIRRPATKLRI